MNRRILTPLVVAASLAGAWPAAAEDIDLFVNRGGTAADIPNVLFMIDNTANWNTPFDSEMAVLISVFRNLATNPDGSARFRVGVMLATETGEGNDNVSGAYVRAAIRPMTSAPMDPATKNIYATMLERFERTKDQGNAGKSALQMAEAWRYFSGGRPIAGNGKAKTDFTGNTAADFPDSATTAEKAAMQAVYNLGNNVTPPDNALPSKNGTPYRSPVPPDYCGRNYIIYISNGPNQQSAADDRDANRLLEAEGGSTTQIPLSPGGSQSNPSDEWARFMKQSPLGIVTYTLDVDRITTGQGPGWSALLKSIADVSSGKYFDVSSANQGAEIADAIGAILSEIQAVNSVFASVSLPLSVNAQGTYLNQVYVGMFRPDEDARPRWFGNLKQYKMATSGNQLVTVDADDRPAINSSTGFLSECARSYWTTADTYWAFMNFERTCDRQGVLPASNSPDGNMVEKGGQGQRLRAIASPGSRNMRTCTSCVAAPDTPLELFSTTNGNVTDSLTDDTINWGRGQDVLNEDHDLPPLPVEMRPSAHGDVVHSRPVAVNFGTNADRKIVVFYGANDGVLRAVNGNQEGDVAGVEPGGELWSFMAPEFFGDVDRLKDNTLKWSYKGHSFDQAAPKPIGFDGAVTAHQGTGFTRLYAGMRRGGRAVYAFNVTNIVEDRNSPGLQWKVGCPNATDDAGCTTDYSGLGQTWSAPKVIQAAGSAAIIMGGGHDTCEDVDNDNGASTPNQGVPINHNCSATSKGRGVYVIDASSGALLKHLLPATSFPAHRSVVADVFAVPGAEGRVLWAYAVDMGGNVYRISGATATAPINDTPPEDWTMTQIASLGCPTTAACTFNRKFMFAPDVVSDPSGVYYLMVGSGDREKPLREFGTTYNRVENYFFMIKDKPMDASWLPSENETCGSDLICLASLLDPNDNPTPTDLANSKGWRLPLEDGEQVVTSAITVYGTTTFSTHTPTAPVEGACTSNLGTAKVYNLRYLDASSRNGTNNRFEVVAGGGLPPSPVAGLVIMDPRKPPVPFIIGASPDSPLQSRRPTEPNTTRLPKSLTYWYIEK